jgi:hypothetical protein
MNDERNIFLKKYVISGTFTSALLIICKNCRVAFYHYIPHSPLRLDSIYALFMIILVTVFYIFSFVGVFYFGLD